VTYTPTEKPRFILRDLPGIAALEERLVRIEAHPNPEWAPEIDGLWDHVARVSRSLFGIDTEEFDVDEADDEEFVAFMQRELEAAGWEFTDGNGRRLHAFEYLVGVIAAAQQGLAGRLPDQPASDEEIQERAGEWGASLADEAAKFKRKR
jgi:hypothetical protein